MRVVMCMQALSNQKLFEMRKRFGHVRCGLQTGDSSLNTEAQIVIMTTEILRNIMYRIAEQVRACNRHTHTHTHRHDDVHALQCAGPDHVTNTSDLCMCVCVYAGSRH